MRKAALLYNPASGQRPDRRLAQVHAAARALEAAGVGVTLLPTQAAGSAGQQAVRAVLEGHDVIFACGGDGTVFDILQGLVAGAPEVPLGIVPLGTGNVLAFDLEIPRDPAAAIRRQLHYVPRRIAAGLIEFEKREGGRDVRYFTLTASVGPDALMIYRTQSGLKGRFGIWEYLRQAVVTGLMHPYEEFQLTIASEPPRVLRGSQLSAVRVTSIGNRIRYFTMDSALDRDDFHAVLVSTPNRVRVLAYFLVRWAKRRWTVGGIEEARCRELRCEALSGQRYRDGVYAQADGEFLGGLPVTIRIIPDAFTLLLPPGRVGV